MDLPPGPSGVNNSRQPVPELNSDDEVEDRDIDDVEYETDTDLDDPNYEQNPPVWSEHSAMGMKEIEFTKTEGFLVPVPDLSPINFFNLMVDLIFLENIVKATNNYAFELYCGPSTTPLSRITRWKELTVAELRVFIGLLLHTGMIKMARLQDYWKTSKLFMSCYSKFMSRDRFLLILRCINFETRPDPNNRASKVQLLIDYFNTKMDSVYYPQKKLCIDEAMVLWRGRLYFRQYIKGKRHKYGIKLYSLCDPHGLILRFFMYCGVLDDYGGKSHAANVVLKLMQGKFMCGHSLFMDNYYNSFSLASNLLRRDTYVTGTLRLDRKYNPAEVKSAKLRKGDTIARYSEGVVVGKWRDNRVVSYISTEFTNEVVTSLNRVQLERQKPLPIVHYNHFMKGVDRADQMMAYYPFERKTLRWYKKIFVHVLQMLLNNAHYLFNEASISSGGKKMNLYDFHNAVVDQLLPDLPEPQRPLKRRSIPHEPSKITDKKGAQNGRNKQKRCRMCSSRGITKRVTWHCEECEEKPGLCIPKCFDEYHK